jgi:MFS family permease
MFLRIRPRIDNKCSILLYSIPFLYTFAATFISPIYPLFVKSLVGKEEYVGFVVSFLGVVCIATTLLANKLIYRYGKPKLLKTSMAGLCLSFFVLSFVNSLYFLLVVEIFRISCSTIAALITALLISESTKKKNLGRTEGKYYGLMNAAWLFGPVLGGTVAQAYGYNATFVIAGLFCLGSFFLSTYDRTECNVATNKIKGSFSGNFKEYFKKKELVLIYILSIGLSFWWIFIFTFGPLYLAELGEKSIGLFFAAIILPLVILEVPFGILADRWSYKYLIFSGFLLMSGVVLGAYFIRSSQTFVILAVLGSIGGAPIEPLKESYFFRVTDIKDQRRFLVIFRTGYEIGFLIAPIIYSTVLLTNNNDYNQLFLAVSAIMFVSGLVSLFLTAVQMKTFQSNPAK